LNTLFEHPASVFEMLIAYSQMFLILIISEILKATVHLKLAFWPRLEKILYCGKEIKMILNNFFKIGDISLQL
jgi:hypothetical protein